MAGRYKKHKSQPLERFENVSSYLRAVLFLLENVEDETGTVKGYIRRGKKVLDVTMELEEMVYRDKLVQVEEGDEGMARNET